MRVKSSQWVKRRRRRRKDIALWLFIMCAHTCMLRLSVSTLASLHLAHVVAATDTPFVLVCVSLEWTIIVRTSVCFFAEFLVIARVLCSHGLSVCEQRPGCVNRGRCWHRRTKQDHVMVASAVLVVVAAGAVGRTAAAVPVAAVVPAAPPPPPPPPGSANNLCRRSYR